MPLTPGAAGPLLVASRLTLGIRGGGAWAPVHLVEDVCLTVAEGETLALIGESGCGKTLTALSILSLLAPPVEVLSGQISFKGNPIVPGAMATIRALRGDRISMVFQEPMAALNPVMKIADQVAEPLVAHRSLSWQAARTRATELLAVVGIRNPDQVGRGYAHQLSGGMRQRAVLAMALACEPDLLIADEPTTALDVTVQAQILRLLTLFKLERRMAMLFVSHDLNLVEGIADQVAVMYAGRVVEQAQVHTMLSGPRHPYSRALWKIRSGWEDPSGKPLPIIAGTVPESSERGPGCVYWSRCERRQAPCGHESPPVADGVACFFPYEQGLGREGSDA